MFRAFSLLAMIQHVLDTVKGNITILVDDLCEGLDYERSINFTKLLFNKLKEKNIQLIVTSNDSFLMNAVGIEYWNILIREKSTVKAFNYKNSKEIFDDFKFTGLNNFDLFSSDFLDKKIK